MYSLRRKSLKRLGLTEWENFGYTPLEVIDEILDKVDVQSLIHLSLTNKDVLQFLNIKMEKLLSFNTKYRDVNQSLQSADLHTDPEGLSKIRFYLECGADINYRLPICLTQNMIKITSKTSKVVLDNIRTLYLSVKEYIKIFLKSDFKKDFL